MSSRPSTKPRRIPIPCIECGTLTLNAQRCDQHQRPVLYDSRYRKQSAFIRATATTCAICNQPARPGDPWTADHAQAGQPDSPLQAAHRSCNSRKGNQ